MRTQNQERLLLAGLTAVFVGYLSVWLPGPAAGLQFLGVELGEWIKFLGVGAIRDLFYLPPIILGLMLVVLTMGWENGRWQTWIMRGLALLVSLLAFPALEDLMGASRSQYLLRVALIGLVGLTVILMALFGKKLVAKWDWLPWVLLSVLGVVGAVLPLWYYLAQVRPYVSNVLGVPVGVGWGLILYTAGCLGITAVCLWQLKR
ncbi:MAG: hypothetical protein GWP17_03810 [Aquificales bacterium]|nr:hypothetical protein [Aquificales bacterium]